MPKMAAVGEATLWKLFEAIPNEVPVVRGAHSDLLTRETVKVMM